MLLEKLQESCLTVKELKEKLDNFEDDMFVVSNVSYGDRNGTQQAILVDEVDFAAVTDSSYSESGMKVIPTDDEDEDTVRVVSLNWGAVDPW